MSDTITVTIDGRSVTGAPDQLRKLLGGNARPALPSMTTAIREVVVSDFKLPIAKAAKAKYPNADWTEEQLVRLVLPAFDNLEPRRRHAPRVRSPHVSRVGLLSDYVRPRLTHEPQPIQPLADSYNTADVRLGTQRVNASHFYKMDGVIVDRVAKTIRLIGEDV